MASFVEVTSQQPCGRLTTLDHSSVERTAFCSYWSNTYSGYGFASPASTKTILHGLTECLIYHHGIPHSIDSDQGTHFTAREVRQWAYDHGIH
jgi:transposase InsO family protein